MGSNFRDKPLTENSIPGLTLGLRNAVLAGEYLSSAALVIIPSHSWEVRMENSACVLILILASRVVGLRLSI